MATPLTRKALGLPEAENLKEIHTLPEAVSALHENYGKPLEIRDEIGNVIALLVIPGKKKDQVTSGSMVRGREMTVTIPGKKLTRGQRKRRAHVRAEARETVERETRRRNRNFKKRGDNRRISAAGTVSFI